MKSFFTRIQEELISAAHLSGISENLKNKLLNHDRVLSIDIKFKRGDGVNQVIKGFRLQHDNTLGPYKGGIRYHQNVSLD
jgi:glutamate dehydrogenase/leucine dehydrogenase